MIINEFRNSLEFFEKWRYEDGVDLSLLCGIEKKLCDISNHISVCHRIIAEKRSEAKSILAVLMLKQGNLISDANEALDILEQVISIQSDFLSLKMQVLNELYQNKIS